MLPLCYTYREIFNLNRGFRMSDQNTKTKDMSSHKEMYGYFIQMSIALVLACILIMVCLLAMTMGSTAAAWVGGIGLTFGLIVVFVSLLAGMSWIPSVVIIAGVSALALAL